jgi:hypothetical protein
MSANSATEHPCTKVDRQQGGTPFIDNHIIRRLGLSLSTGVAGAVIQLSSLSGEAVIWRKHMARC